MSSKLDGAVKKETREKIEIRPFSRTPVDIIIPYHGQYEKVSKLVESILVGIRSNPYQICLVDDASPNATFGEKFKEMDKPPVGYESIIKVFRNEKQLGFGGALKRGFDETKQPYVVFLNSDCIVEDVNWLIAMGQSLLKLKKQNVRMVSSLLSNCNNSKLVAKRDERKEDVILTDGFLPLISVMAHRELFHRIGGFVKSYPYGWYEDEELAFRMKKFGFKQAICGKSWIRHHGEATLKELWIKNPDAIKIMESNYDLCVKDISSLK